MRLVVTGGRDYSDRDATYWWLDLIDTIRPIGLLIHGNARGADTLCKEWCAWKGVEHQAFTPDWEGLGRAAGCVRNQQMLDEGKPDLAICFPGGKGTEDMVRRVLRKGIPLVRADVQAVKQR